MLLNVVFFSVHFSLTKYLSEILAIKLDHQLLCLGLIFTPFAFMRVRRNNESALVVFHQDSSTILFVCVRIALSTATDILPIIALNHIRENSGITVIYIYPLWAIIFNNIYNKRCLEWMDVVVSITCFAGVCCIMKPFSEINKDDSYLGFLLCLATGICFGLLPIFNKRMTELFSTDILMLYVGITNLILSPIVYLCSSHNEIYSLFSIFILVLYGLCGFLGLYTFLAAVSVGNIDKIMTLEYLVIVLAFFFSLFLFNESIDYLDILGAVLITVVNILKVFYDSAKNQTTEEELLTKSTESNQEINN